MHSLNLKGDFLLLYVLSVFAAGEIPVRKKTGEAVTLHTNLTRLDNNFIFSWTYVNHKRVDALAIGYKGGVTLDNRQFECRLHIDSNTGSLMIRNLIAKDTGSLTFQVLEGGACYLQFFLSVFDSDFPVSVEEKKIAQGDSVTLDSGVDKIYNKLDFQWYYGPERADTLIARWNNNVTKMDFMGKFSDKLQFDPETGALTFLSLTTDHSGFYSLIMYFHSEHYNTQDYRVIVYAPLSVPDIKALKTPSEGFQSCSLECSVENGREVTLSWYRGEDRQNSTSSLQSSHSSLTLPLLVTRENRSATYRCVSENPVSNRTAALLNLEDLCPHLADPHPSARNQWIIIVVGALIVVIFVFYCLHKRQQSEEEY